MIFGLNLYEKFKASNAPLHFGKDAMPRLNDILNYDIEANNFHAFTFDWSAYDTTCPAWLINQAFDILEESIDFTRR